MTDPTKFFQNCGKEKLTDTTTHRLWLTNGSEWRQVAELWPDEHGLMGRYPGVGLIWLLPADQHPDQFKEP